ncbi:hypothetical protein F383_27318 [Gossypium arboreum]|uniref:Uncharacterized protein n=1 Tax=Gossypium arboreum TaxID=29729 RepID=A0A0B0P7S2_GOSAR|nr:hypothetical protein F383_27318 [Gossypium arboreum]
MTMAISLATNIIDFTFIFTTLML